MHWTPFARKKIIADALMRQSYLEAHWLGVSSFGCISLRQRLKLLSKVRQRCRFEVNFNRKNN